MHIFCHNCVMLFEYIHTPHTLSLDVCSVSCNPWIIAAHLSDYYGYFTIEYIVHLSIMHCTSNITVWSKLIAHFYGPSCISIEWKVRLTLTVHEQIAHHQHPENRHKLLLKLQEGHYIRHALGQGKECSKIYFWHTIRSQGHSSKICISCI